MVMHDALGKQAEKKMGRGYSTDHNLVVNLLILEDVEQVSFLRW